MNHSIVKLHTVTMDFQRFRFDLLAGIHCVVSARLKEPNGEINPALTASIFIV